MSEPSDEVQSSGVDVYFLLRGAFDPAAITAEVGISPSETWRVGDPFDKAGIRRRTTDAWLLRSLAADVPDIQQQISSIVAQLRPRWSAVVRLCHEHSAYVHCVIRQDVQDPTPAMYLNSAAISALAELQAGIDIDLYLAAGGGRENS